MNGSGPVRYRRKALDGIVRAVTILAATIFVAASPRAFMLLVAPAEDAGEALFGSEAREYSARNERLIIPTLGIDANIQKVGMTLDREMGVPDNFSDVAWYKHGPRPGEAGSAVITGHLDNGLGLPAVFYELRTLEKGDEVLVVQDGKELRFAVTEIARYSYDEVPEERIFAGSGGRYLNLITCSGDWMRSARMYDERLVVYTELVDEHDQAQ